ncbi:MAG: SDR family oxidoreductase [Pseudomonadota bacterium]|nr:MAG: SDR family oxidoreductase [Pseudomonadota bacterium]
MADRADAESFESTGKMAKAHPVDNTNREDAAMSGATTVLVTGAGGFLGGAIVERLLAAGLRVVACSHGQQHWPAHPALSVRPIALEHMTEPSEWQPLLAEIDAVVNCAGILRENRSGEFEQIHHRAPLALARACIEATVAPFVQISALGHPADGEFIASKLRFDETLAALPLACWILRPSVVISLRGSYGGTSALRAAAALPGLLLVPGDGNQRLQPLLLEDLAECVCQAVERPSGHDRPLPIAGEAVVTVRELLQLMRGWLRISRARFELRLPVALVSGLAGISDRLRLHPIGRTTWRMLQRGNVAETAAAGAVKQTLGVTLRSVPEVFRTSTSFVQDRWHARLKNLAPLAWLSLVLIWLLSGLTGLLAGPDQYQPVLSEIGLPEFAHASAAKATGALNLVLGLALALRWRPRLVLWLMLICVLAYTGVLGIGLPKLWLELLGGLIKNAAVLVVILFSLATCNER